MSKIHEIRQGDYDRFEKNRRFEEMTDIAERLSYPIDITIDYAARDGAAYAVTDTVERPFHNQTWQAYQAAERQYSGDQSFQVERLRLEHEEALLVDRLANGEITENILIKFSKVPDAIVEGTTSIKGYRRDILRSFVRVYRRTETGASCRIITLDHNHSEGLEKVGKLLGIDVTAPSEEVLSQSVLWDVDSDTEAFVEEFVTKIIARYDESIYAATGQNTHAGSNYTNKQDAMSAISAQSHLISKHMHAIAEIMSKGRGENLLEAERQKTAAAIKLASEGHAVNSSSDVAVAAEVSSGNYDRDCPTANIGMNQAAEITKENKWSYGECLVCFAKTMVGSCMVCSGCAAADDMGVDLLKVRERNLRRLEKVQCLASIGIDKTYAKGQFAPHLGRKRDIVKERYGEHAVASKRIVIGGTRSVVLDRRTNKVLSHTI